MRRAIAVVVLVFLLALPGTAAAATVLTPIGDYTWSGSLETTYQPNTVDVSLRPIPFATGYSVQTATARWDRTDSYTSSQPNLNFLNSAGPSLATTLTAVAWYEVNRRDTLNAVGGTPRILAIGETYGTGTFLGFPPVTMKDYSGSAFPGPLTFSGHPGTAVPSSGGSWAQNNGNTLRVGRVLRITKDGGFWKLESRSVAYLLQCGRWSAVSVTGSVQRSTATALTLTPYINYLRTLKSATTIDGTNVVHKQAGTYTMGGGYTTDETLSAQLWADATMTSLEKWTSQGSAVASDNVWLGDFDLKSIGDSFSGQLGGIDWLWPFQMISGWR